MACSNSEFGIVIKTIISLYPNNRAMFSETETVAMWYQMLKECDFKDLVEAVKRCANESDYPPSIAKIKAKVKDVGVDRMAKILTQKHFDSVQLGTAPTPQIEEKNRKPRRFETYEELMEATGGNYTMEELEQMLLAQAERIHREEAENDSV